MMANILQMPNTPTDENEYNSLRYDVLAELARHDVVGRRLEHEDGKQAIRDAYQFKRAARSASERAFINKHSVQLLQHFAEGSEIRPDRIAPKLVPVEKAESFEGRLFRFATLLWSVPVSRGYGRRMRYLVVDSSNNKLMGLFALGDPVINMKARDVEVGWNVQDRMQRLYHVMDAYVLGAVPPYNDLLVGKLVALAATTNEVRKQFRTRYAQNVTVICQETKRTDLVLVTTTSALGRSSIFNRLRVQNGVSFRSIGFTSGYGHFHVSDELFDRIRDWLRQDNDAYADSYAFGKGPNWRLRTLRRAFTKLGIDKQAINHGIKREIFIAPLAENYREILTGQSRRPSYLTLPFREVYNQFRERWLLPRSERVSGWSEWNREMLLARLDLADEDPARARK